MDPGEAKIEDRSPGVQHALAGRHGGVGGHILAMKIDAGKPEDASDIERLMNELGVTSTDEAVKTHRETYPHTTLPRTTLDLVEKATGGGYRRAKRVAMTPGRVDEQPQSRWPADRECTNYPSSKRDRLKKPQEARR